MSLVTAPEVRRGEAVIVRPAVDADLPSILRLADRALGPGAAPWSEAFWRWKHEQSPFGRSPALVACSGDEVIGLRVFLRWDLRAGRRRLRAVRAVDTATHPSFQGRGIFRQLTLELVARLTAEGAHLVFNTPNTKSGPGYLGMGWRQVGKRTVWVRPARLRPREIGRSEAACPGRAAGSASEADRERALALLASPELASMLEDEADAPGAQLRTARSPRYLRWRYLDGPGLAYEVRWRGRYPDAALVVTRSCRRRGIEELRIVEIVASARPASVGAAAKLLRALAARTSSAVVTACAAWGTPEAAALRLAGFVPIPRAGPRLLVRRLAGSTQGSEPDPERSSSWRLGAGDLEVF